MLLNNNILAKNLIHVVFVIQTFLLSTSVCTGCDNDCDIRNVTNSSTVPSFLGEVFATQEDIWFKFGESFDKLIIQLKIDKEFDFQGDKISDQKLILSKGDLLKAAPYTYANQWNKINVKVVKKQVSLAPDPYIIKADVGEHSFVKETGLWWRLNTIKSMQFLAEGGFQISVGCHPCEPEKPKAKPVILHSVKDHLVGYGKQHVSPPTEICGTSPWIYILTGIIILLVLVLILLLITFKYFHTRQNASYKKKTIGLPYLEGNYFKEENIYDDLTSCPKSKKSQENIYDEINPGPSSKGAHDDNFSTSTKTGLNHSKSISSLPTKVDEVMHQSTSFPSLEEPCESKCSSSDYSSLTSTASSLDSHQQSPLQDTLSHGSSSDCASKKDDHLQALKDESCPPQRSPHCFENPSYSFN